MRELILKFGQRLSSVFIEPGLLRAAGRWIRKYADARNVAVISDTTVSGLYADDLLASLRGAGLTADLYTVPDGEDSKTLDRVSGLITLLLESGLHRDDLILALGGGVVGDLAGFVAATFLRGVRWVGIPTTLLAQVDSGIGGKVGVNHPLGKNLIGNFHQPEFVLIDSRVLGTLPEREMWAGMGEVVKYGLIWDKRFFDDLENQLENLVALNHEDRVDEVVFTCCKIKAEIVEQDEKEKDLRRILNFGHTLGHALEAATDFQVFRHGEAVVHGMRFAAWASTQKNRLPAVDLERIESLLARFPIPGILEALSADRIVTCSAFDKKRLRHGQTLVLLEEIGEARMERTESIKKMIEEWLGHAGR